MRYVSLLLMIVACAAWVFGFAISLRSQSKMLEDARYASQQAKMKKKKHRRHRRRPTLQAGAGFALPPTPEPSLPRYWFESEEGGLDE